MNKYVTSDTVHKIIFYLISAAITIAYFVLMFLFIQPSYAINDDRAMYRIISGEMTGYPDGHAVFILYPLSWFMSRLFEIIPIIDWYALIMIGCMCLCLSLLLYRGLTKGKYLFALSIFVIFHILMLEHIIMFQFTIVAAILGATTVFWILTMEDDQIHMGEILVGVLLIFLTVCVRKSVFYMCCPFIVLAYIYKNIKVTGPKGKRKIRGRRISAVVISVAVVLGALVINEMAYASEEWQDYMEYNATRSEIFDYYGFPEYTQYQDFYEECGISEAEYACLASYNLVMDTENHAEKLESIAEKGKEIYYENYFLNLKEHMWQAWSLFKEQSLYPYHVFMIWSLPLMLILCLKQHKKTAFITWLLGGIVYIAEIGYLILKGRLILRVLTALDIVFIFFTISFFIIYWKEFGKMVKGAIVVGIGLGLGVSILNIPMIKVSAEELQYGNEVLRAITQYCSQREENFYFSFGEMCITTRDTRLLTDEGCWNYTGFGGWTANSPLEKKRLERAGIENVEWSILNDDHVYIIGPDAEMTEKERVLREYLNNKYSNVIWEKTDVIDLYYEDYIVWKVSIEQ